MIDQKTAAETRAELEEYIAVVALRVAVDTAVAICRDPKATAAARASATNSLMRAGALGGFARNFDPASGEKEPHEMTMEELEQSRRKLQLMREAREAITAQNGVGGGHEDIGDNPKPRKSSAFD